MPFGKILHLSRIPLICSSSSTLPYSSELNFVVNFLSFASNSLSYCEYSVRKMDGKNNKSPFESTSMSLILISRLGSRV